MTCKRKRASHRQTLFDFVSGRKAYHEHQYVWLRSGACGPPHTQTGLTDLGERGLTQSEADDACTLWTGRHRILRPPDIGDTQLVVRMAVV